MVPGAATRVGVPGLVGDADSLLRLAKPVAQPSCILCSADRRFCVCVESAETLRVRVPGGADLRPATLPPLFFVGLRFGPAPREVSTGRGIFSTHLDTNRKSSPRPARSRSW